MFTCLACMPEPPVGYSMKTGFGSIAVSVECQRIVVLLSDQLGAERSAWTDELTDGWRDGPAGGRTDGRTD